MSNFASTSLYVGDLHPDVTETTLFEVFKQAGPVASIKIPRNASTRESLGYAYVNFHTVVDAERCLETLNYTVIKNKPCRIMWSLRDPSKRKSGVGNIFVRNLDKSIDNKSLFDIFSQFGKILSCKVVTDENGISRGYGYVHYEDEKEAELVKEKLADQIIHGKKIDICPFESKKSMPVEYTNVYVKNLDPSIDEEKLRELFSSFGTITQTFVKLDENGVSKGFGFVNFSKTEEAREAVNKMNNEEFMGKKLFVGKAQKKAEREAELKRKFEQIRKERMKNYLGVNLYVKNLDDGIDDETLKNEFSSFGTITSAKVMKDEKGVSRGFGFVCFSTTEEATRAVNEMHGKILVRKPLYVAVAQPRDVRRAQLEVQYKQAQNNLAARAGLGGPLYATPGSPVFYPSGAPMPPTARGQGFIYPQQMIPRSRWVPGSQTGQSGRPTNFQGVPSNYGSNSQRSQRNSRNNRTSQPQNAGGSGRGQGAANNSRRNFKYTSNARNPPQMGYPVAQPPVGPQPPLENVSPFSSLATATPEERKQILGEALFLRIAAHEPDFAGKITGMLLESLDWTELIGLVDSPETLMAKINEAREVLRTHVEQEGDPTAEESEQ